MTNKINLLNQLINLYYYGLVTSLSEFFFHNCFFNFPCFVTIDIADIAKNQQFCCYSVTVYVDFDVPRREYSQQRIYIAVLRTHHPDC